MLKLAFSTLGCPDWSFADIVSTAKDLGYDGVEVRGIGKILHAPAAKLFSDGQIADTKARLSKVNLPISCLTSGVALNEEYKIESQMVQGKEYIDLAQKLDVPFVRVMPDSGPTPGQVVFKDVAGHLEELAQYAGERQVTLLVENNGVFAKSTEMKRLVDAVASPHVAVLWDVNHPVRNYGETPQETWSVLHDYVRYLHVKDSVAESGKTVYRMIGDGDLPLKEVVDLLKAADFDGYLSLEWVKRWCLSLAEPGIVFPHYVRYMRELINK